jgi:hypothetical protein
VRPLGTFDLEHTSLEAAFAAAVRPVDRLAVATARGAGHGITSHVTNGGFNPGLTILALSLRTATQAAATLS